MENKPTVDQLKNPEGLQTFPMNKDHDYFLDKSIDWLAELLKELNENTSQLPEEELLKRSRLDVNLNVKKCFKPQMGEYLLVKGKIDAAFFTDCVRTLTLMKDEVNVEFQCCLLDKALESDDQYNDQIEIYTDNELFDLYYYERRKVDLKELIHEQIYLNKNPYPTRDKTSPIQNGGNALQ